LSKVVVINVRDRVTHPSHPIPPADLGYLVKYLKRMNYSVTFLDLIEGDEKFNLVKRIKASHFIIKPGIKSFPFCEKLAAEIKGEKKAKVIFVGPVAKVFLRRLVKNKNIDSIAYGEYEFVLPRLLKNTPKIINAPLRKDISSIGTFDRSIFHKNYFIWYPTKKVRRKKFGFILFSRGCPHSCYFCSEVERASIGKVVRSRDAHDVIKEIKYLKSLGVNTVYFFDDNFLVDKKNAEELLELLSKNNFNIEFVCQTRPDYINERVAKKLRRAGFSTVCLGIESFSDRSLYNMNKGIDSKTCKRAVKILKRFKFRVVIFLIIGTPNETILDVKKTFNTTLKLKPDLIQVSFFTPLPGSPIFEKLKIGPLKEWGIHDNIPINLSKIPTEILPMIQRLFYLKFYLLSSAFFRLILDTPIFLLNAKIYLILIKEFLNFLLGR